MDLDKYQLNNRANWDDRASVHATSEMYAFAKYIEDPKRISDVVRFDAPVTKMAEHQGIEWQFIPSAVLEGDQWFLPEDQRKMMPLMFSVWATKKP